jgi:DNA topoisomerase-6 subunit A
MWRDGEFATGVSQRMLSSGLKFELDALANKDFQYLTKTYLPKKLKEKDWLD